MSTHKLRLPSTVGLAVVMLLAFLLFQPSSIYAANFNKNRLIDDSLFVDTNSMSVAQIQAFLDDNGSLLANWVDDVDMRRPSDNCIVHHATGMTAAEVIHEAATAWNAQVFNGSGCAIAGAYWGDPGYSNYTLKTISPKALLVTLQKEQSLISANGTYSSNSNNYKNPTCCSSNEYKLARAMGYGVPDSGSINEKYLGFYNQINWAAWQLRFNYERSAGNTAWDEVGYITYTGPMIKGNWRRCASCSVESFDGYYPIDGSPLYIDNQSTAALYYYTPHTYPGYFGNYNFVQFYSDWFGSVIGNYAATFAGQSPNPTLLQGEDGFIRFRYKNSGGVNWYDNVGKNHASAPYGTKPVVLKYKNYGSASAFDTTWLSNGNIPTKLFTAVYESDGSTLASNQHIAEPGQIAEFEVELTTPMKLKPGSYKEHFTPVHQGGGNMNILNTFRTITVQEANYKARFVTQSSYPNIKQTETATGYFHYKNVGNATWYDGVSMNYPDRPRFAKPVKLGTKPLGRDSAFGGLWGGKKKARAASAFAAVYESNGVTLAGDQHIAEPGQIVRFEFPLLAKLDQAPGTYREKFTPLLEGHPTKMPQLNTFLDVKVSNAVFKAKFKGQSGYPSIAQGGSATVFFRYQNNGNVNWYDQSSTPNSFVPPVYLSTRPYGRKSVFGYGWGTNRRIPNRFFTTVYQSDGTTLAADQTVVKPGQIVLYSFDLSVLASQPKGVYKERFTPVLGNTSEMNLLGTFLNVTIY